jgi:C4-dicarboxylate-specific signal transduction histidine kinase
VAGIAGLIARHPRRAWAAVAACTLAAALAAAAISHTAQQRERQDLLDINIAGTAIEAMSLTLDSKLMGAVSLMGLADPTVKLESRLQAAPNSPALLALISTVAPSFDAQGLFIVGQDGKVKTSWDDTGISATGTEVGFRPYFKRAMQGRDSVYAAVSLSRKERALYFGAPVYASAAPDSHPIGAVVARTGLDKLDKLLAGAGHAAMLLSPDGVVFASSRPAWLGRLAANAAPERAAALEAQRQFPGMFNAAQPRRLPFSAASGITTLDGQPHAVAVAGVDWNDPAGDWRLVVLEDLSRTVAWSAALPAALTAAFATLLVGALLLRLAGSQAAQRAAGAEVARMAADAAQRAERKMELAQMALRMQQAGGRDAIIQSFLSDCHRLLGALQGVVYVDAPDGTLRLAGSFACSEPPARIAAGDGLLGQCASERKPRLITAGQHGAAWTISSALGAMAPAALLLAPLLLQDRLLGVAELALPQRPGTPDYEQFLAAVDLLAINLETARRHTGAPAEEYPCSEPC